VGEQGGQSIVEFTLVLIPLLLLLFGIIEFGLVMYDKVTVVQDAREAARWGHPNATSGQLDYLPASVRWSSLARRPSWLWSAAA